MDFIRIQYWTIPGQNVKVMPTTQKNFGQNNEKEFGIIMAKEVTQEQIEMIEEMVARAQKAAAIIETYDQARVDRLAQAVAAALYDLKVWAPLCDEAVDETHLGDKVSKRNKRNKLKLILRDCLRQPSVGIIEENKEKGLVKGHGNFPVYIDSPLAIEATRIFKDTDPDCFDADTRALLEKGIDPITFPGLRVTVTSDESRMINADRVPKVILSASGMCEAGRIRHHLKHNLWRPECTILFVGYQAVGTLGRTLLEGATTVKLFGEPIEVQAELCQLTGMSGHADREGLLRWVNSFEQKPKRVFVMHGEDETEDHFVQTLTEQGFTACAPYNGAQWAIGAEGAVCLQEGMRVRIEHKANEGQSRAASVFQRLVSAGKRLLRVIEHNEGGANKDLAKFADQINALCDKWDR